MLVEKISRRMIRAQPIAVQQQLMNFVRINYLLELDVLGAQPAHQVYRLRELDIAIVVAMNQQHR